MCFRIRGKAPIFFCEIAVLLCFRYGGFQVVDMKKGLNSAQHSGSVHVTFNVSDDVASHIRQSVVGSWGRMQDLGVVSIRLDKEQLMHDSCGLCTEIKELQYCTQQSHHVNSYTESEQVLESYYRSSGHGTARKRSRSRLTKRTHNDGSSYQFTSRELCSSAASAKSSFQERLSCELEDNACQTLDQNKEVARSTTNKHISSESDPRMLSVQLPNHMSSVVAFGGTAVSTDRCAVSAKNQFVINTLQPQLDELRSAITLNTMQSHDLPPPSTPFVPKRRKRRKPADSGSETVSAKVASRTAVNSMDHTTLPIHVNGSIKAMPNLCWQNCTNRRFQVNGQYPQQFNVPVFRHCAVSSAQLVPSSRAGSHTTVALKNYAQLPVGRQMVLDSSMTVGRAVAVLPSTTAELENSGIVSAKRNVTASSNQHLQLGSSVSYPSLHQCGQLRQIVPTLPQACGPKLSNHFSQGTLESRRRNPETRAATGIETKVVDCAKRFCRSVSSQSCDASLALPTERNMGSETSTSSTPLEIKLSETLSLYSSEASRLDCVEPVLKSLSQPASSSSVDMTANMPHISALTSVISTASVGSSSKSVNFVVQSDTVHNNQAVFSSAVLMKQKPVVVNGYHFTSDCSPAEAWHASCVLVPSSVPQTVHNTNFCLSTTASQDTDIRAFQTAADHSSVTVAATGEASQMANMQSHRELAQSVNGFENSRSVSGWLDIIVRFRPLETCNNVLRYLFNRPVCLRAQRFCADNIRKRHLLSLCIFVFEGI